MNAVLSTILLKAGIPILFFILGLIVARFLKQWIHKSPTRLERAQEIALIADRVTDELRLLAPSAHWSEWMDEAVDRVISACGLTDADEHRALAHREVASQILKKSMKPIVK